MRESSGTQFVRRAVLLNPVRVVNFCHTAEHVCRRAELVAHITEANSALLTGPPGSLLVDIPRSPRRPFRSPVIHSLCTRHRPLEIGPVLRVLVFPTLAGSGSADDSRHGL